MRLQSLELLLKFIVSRYKFPYNVIYIFQSLNVFDIWFNVTWSKPTRLKQCWCALSFTHTASLLAGPLNFDTLILLLICLIILWFYFKFVFNFFKCCLFCCRKYNEADQCRNYTHKKLIGQHKIAGKMFSNEWSCDSFVLDF